VAAGTSQHQTLCNTLPSTESLLTIIISCLVINKCCNIADLCWTSFLNTIPSFVINIVIDVSWVWLLAVWCCVCCECERLRDLMWVMFIR
jgi:hypothetical protein